MANGTTGPTDPSIGSDLPASSYQIGWQHGYSAGLRACLSKAPPPQTVTVERSRGNCCCGGADRSFGRFLLGLFIGILLGLFGGLFLGLFLANTLSG